MGLSTCSFFGQKVGLMTKIVSILGLSLFMCIGDASAVSITQITPVGSSGKGQFIALEEAKVTKGDNKLQMKLRILNAWKNKYVGKALSLEKGFTNESELNSLKSITRSELKELAQKKLDRYGIRQNSVLYAN
ncbi:MAG: hypothetical protein ACI9QD_000086 [Thermoproteota archaeon]|jgi:hypothetical protein